jgi:hypothetical protein
MCACYLRVFTYGGNAEALNNIHAHVYSDQWLLDTPKSSCISDFFSAPNFRILSRQKYFYVLKEYTTERTKDSKNN